ncbi:hypothetical protein B0I32_117169 [Nonomuraea fuscirosea]|uniref:MalT-like TPR region domain-containing protein n=2 Tax=Nonomuraea fuscirosea TaxID=1291556 RepID=A0A2T0MQL0_9ACTN|nr:hypothetical protein B0I32_117169 [Nonomuraea fuscirosea]
MTFQNEARAAFRRGDLAGVLRLATTEAERARTCDDVAGEVEALYTMARAALQAGDLHRAEEMARSALEVALLAGDRRREERPRHVLAAVARRAGDHFEARKRHLASIDLYEALRLPAMVLAEQHKLALAELRLGNRDRARVLLAHVRDQVFREGHRSMLPHLGLGACALASADGDHRQAAWMLGFTSRAYDAVGLVPDADDARDLAAIRDRAVAALGEAGLAAHCAIGASWTAVDAFGLTWES